MWQCMACCAFTLRRCCCQVNCEAGADRCTYDVLSSGNSTIGSSGRKLQQVPALSCEPDACHGLLHSPSRRRLPCGCTTVPLSASAHVPCPQLQLNLGCFRAAALAVRFPPRGGAPSAVPLSQLRPGDIVQVRWRHTS
jgi:hypothetical protein